MFNTAKYLEKPMPFKPHGRTPDEGFDCWGLLWWVYKKEYGIELPSYSDDYASISNHGHLAKLFREGIESSDWILIESGREQQGDGLLLRMIGQPVHVGIVVGGGCFLHVHAGIDVGVESYKSWKWKNRVLGFYRHRRLL